jgi:hypothetical protein
LAVTFDATERYHARPLGGSRRAEDDEVDAIGSREIE